MSIREIRSQRAELITKAQKLYADAKADGREVLNDTERPQFDALLAGVTPLDEQIRQHEQAETERANVNALAASLAQPTARRSAPPEPQNRNSRRRINEGQEYRDVFDQYFSGKLPMSQVEERGMVLGTDASGGYMSLPTDLAKFMLETIDDTCDIHMMATHLSVSGATTVRIPKVTVRGDDADWTTEIQSITADTSLAFGKTDLTPIMLTKLVKISRVLLTRVPAAQALVLKQMGRLFGVTWEKAALTGTGSGQPLGIFVASSSGISTGRDMSTGNTQTEVSYEGLLRAKYSVKQAYLARPTCKWIAHPNFMVNVLLLVDGMNRPIFVPGAEGREDTLLGKPIRYSEFAPNTWTTGLYVAAIGDISEYYIADAGDYSVQVADQLYAATNEIGFIGRCEQDGKPGQEEAFARVKLA